MHLNLPILFLTAILGVSAVSGIVLGVSFLKGKWAPRIEFIDNLPVDPDKTEFRFGGGGYPNERCECHHLIYTSWSAYRFRVTLESFSDELQVSNGEKRVGTAPYVLQKGNLPDCRCIWLSFTVVMPNQTGTYELELSIRLFGLLFSRENKWKYVLTADIFVPKPLPEECLSITIDRETCHQGDITTITIENVSNETQCFGNAAYDVYFERFNGEYWEFYDAVPGAEVITCLEPGQTGQVTWKLGGHTDCPFPAGRYRVGTHGVYAEFKVTEAR